MGVTDAPRPDVVERVDHGVRELASVDVGVDLPQRNVRPERRPDGGEQRRIGVRIGERPPVPTAWKTIVSKPRSSSFAWTRSTQGVVTPIIVSATSGRSSARGGGAPLTIPAIALAAFERILREMRLRPATSVTGARRRTSLVPT